MRNKIILTSVLAGIVLSINNNSVNAETTVKLEDLTPELKSVFTDMKKNYGKGDFNSYYELQHSDNGEYKFVKTETPSADGINVNYKYQSTYGNSKGDDVKYKYYTWQEVYRGYNLNPTEENIPGKTITFKYLEEDKTEPIKTSSSNVQKNITGNFIENTLDEGNIITNSTEIDSITDSYFVDNVTKKSNGYIIYNDKDGSIDTIKNNSFINNKSRDSLIYNEGTINSIENNNFIGNQTNITLIDIKSGGLYDDSQPGIIYNIKNNNFIGNYSSSSYGVLFVTGKKGDIINIENNNFIDNSGGTSGGIGISQVDANIVNNNFINNYGPYSGAISAFSGCKKITVESSNFIGNKGFQSPGAISSEADLLLINNSNFIGNETTAGWINGGAILSRNIEVTNSNFIANSANLVDSNGGALASTGFNIKSSNFISNMASGYGGAIYNEYSFIFDDETYDNFITNSYFSNNQAGVHGGAIYTKVDMDIIADNGKTIFTGNTANGENEAIYVDYTTLEDLPWEEREKYKDKLIIPVLTLKSKNKGQIIFNDSINGKEGYKIELTGTSDSTIEINNDIKNAEIEHTGSVVTNIYDGKYLNNNNSLTLTSGNMNIKSLGLEGIQFKNLNLNGGNINLDSIDVDLNDKTMGRLTAEQYDGTNGKIVVKGFNILKDSDANQVGILFADKAIKDRVQNNVRTAETNSKIAYSPIYKYNVSYSTNGEYGDDGYFVFTRGDFANIEPASNPSENYNPAVLSTSVAAQSGGYATMNEAYNFAFEHTDSFSSLPSNEKAALFNANKYAINEPSVALQEEVNNAFWIRPYTTFESIPLKNGPDVDTITYGTLVGADSDFIELKNGWKSLSSVYIGYNGSTQHYQGVDTVQNGGLLGVTQSFYKNNFFSAITASVGASLGSSDNMYGSENFTMLMSGLAAKNGYNFGFKDDKFIIQPSLLLAYTFVNTFDYTNSAGVRIKSDPLHAVQIRPDLKFIFNSESGWQPYLSAGVIWNLLDKSDVSANDVKLPSMSIKPYAEYGVGIQKRWKDKYTGFAQVMVRNGGRNGAALSFGLNWKLGKYDKL